MREISNPVTTTLFELFKAGPGPSSSHTIAPMRAALEFRAMLDALPPDSVRHAQRIEVRLFGSLSATALGHGTDTAIAAGLLGLDPADCPPGMPAGVFNLPEKKRRIKLAASEHRLANSVERQSIRHGDIIHDFPYSNTLRFSLLDKNEGEILHATAYSTGGGFVLWEDGPYIPGMPRSAPRVIPPFPYDSMESLRECAEAADLSIPQIIVRNEAALTNVSSAGVLARLDGMVEMMRASVQRGTRNEGLLPGTLGVWRKAARLARKADALDDPLNRFLGLLNAYAFAVAEENAAGGIIVTAPTCGAAGVLPAVLTMMEGHIGLGTEAVRNGLLAAAAVGFLAKHNAAIAGAEVGCQGEVGVASAMAAAMLAQARGFPQQIVENAAEIALEHHLGLTCDPVGGYVQIPCIERNAMGALKAYNACLVASTEDAALHRVSLDTAIFAMGATGRDMDVRYKETSQGGLAVWQPEC